MTPSQMETLSIGQKPVHKSETETTTFPWKPLYRIGGTAASTIVGIMVIQIIVFIAWPPPGTVLGYFTLFHKNWLLGLLSLDLLYIVDNVLVIPLYLALYAALRRASPSFMAIALAFGLVGIAAYFASNTAFEMLSLSNQYAAATTTMQRVQFLAAGQAMLATYQGTAFNVYYILGAIATLIISVVMMRSSIFGKVTAYAGIAAGALMLIPSTAGTIGLFFAFCSLVPTAVWLILTAQRLLQLSQGGLKEEKKLPAPA
ncbi:MAG TPA: DUF4386 family protein [Ktedonobacteraceae bacterium]|nr:DUF4386 family protein [Ktedonobacteraceae bacterium]